MLKWTLIAIAVLVALIVLTALIGALLPKSHVASRRVRFRQTPEKIWATITDFASWPSWNPAARRMERLADHNGHAVWAMVGKQGKLPMEVEESTAPRRLVTRIVGDKLPFGGSWTYEIEPSEEGCTVTITEDGEIYNPIFRFMARFVFGYTATMESFLRALDEKVAAAAPVQ